MATINESEGNGSTSTADSISVNDTIIGTLNIDYDDDYYKINLAGNTFVTIDFNDPEGTNSTYTSIYLYDHNGDTVAYDTGNYIDGSLSAYIATAGTYYVRFYHSGSAAGKATYTATVTQATVAAPLDQPITSRFLAEDTDVYKVTTTESTFITLDLNDVPGTGTVYSNIYLYDQYGTKIDYTTGNYEDASLSSFVGPGDYYFMVYNGGADTQDHTVTLSKATVAAPLDTPIVGTFIDNDTDVYKVVVAESTFITLNLNDAPGTGSNYSNIYLYDQYGTKVDYTTGNYNDAGLSYFANPGTYYFMVYNNGADTATHSVTVSQATTPITFDEPMSSLFIANGLDVYKVHATENTFITLNLDDAPNSGSAYSNINLYNQYGTKLEYTTGNYNDATLSSFVEAGDYYFEVYNSAAETLNHTVTISEAATTTPLNQTMSSIFTAEMQEVYKLDLAANSTLTVNYNDAASTGSNYTNIRLYDQYGTQLGYTTGNYNDASLSKSITDAGTYFVKIYNSGAETGTHTLEFIGLQSGTSSNDVLNGNAQNNTFKGDAGNDTIDGGAGIDTAIFTGSTSQYQIQKSSNNTVTVTDTVANRDGTNTLSSVEILSFSDMDMNLWETSASTDEDVQAVLSPSDFAITDIDGNTVFSNVTITSLPSKGSLALNNSPVSVNQIISFADINAGNLVFTPEKNSHGNGYDTFTFNVLDGVGNSNTTHTITMNVTPVNDAPTASNTTAQMNENGVLNGVLPTGTDIDGDTINYALNNEAHHGSISVNTNGNYTYTPDSGFSGIDLFTYTVSDGNGGENSYSVKVEVASAQPQPEPSAPGVTFNDVAKLYVATFNRAPDAAGLNWWVYSSGLKIEQIAQSFFDQPETKALYPTGTSNTSFVTSVYDNLFNRAPDQAGLDYWVHELDTGSVAKQNFILAMMNGALDSDVSLDKTILDNKMNVGLFFVQEGLNDVDVARSVMEYVDSMVSSVEDSLGMIMPDVTLLGVNQAEGLL